MRWSRRLRLRRFERWNHVAAELWPWPAAHCRRRRETQRAGMQSRRVRRLGLYGDTARESPGRVRYGHRGVQRGGLWPCPPWTRARQSSVGPVVTTCPGKYRTIA
jgi:hypothetical protein